MTFYKKLTIELIFKIEVMRFKLIKKLPKMLKIILMYKINIPIKVQSEEQCNKNIDTH